MQKFHNILGFFMSANLYHCIYKIRARTNGISRVYKKNAILLADEGWSHVFPV
jgi:hypothetical protein